MSSPKQPLKSAPQRQLPLSLWDAEGQRLDRPGAPPTPPQRASQQRSAPASAPSRSGLWRPSGSAWALAQKEFDNSLMGKAICETSANRQSDFGHGAQRVRP